MRTLYVTIIGMAPETRDRFQEQMTTKQGRRNLAEYFFEKIRPEVAKCFGEEGADYESAYGLEVMPGKEFVDMLNPDETIRFSARIPIAYLFEEWLDVGSTWRDVDTFGKELGKLQNTMLLFFIVDV